MKRKLSGVDSCVHPPSPHCAEFIKKKARFCRFPPQWVYTHAHTHTHTRTHTHIHTHIYTHSLHRQGDIYCRNHSKRPEKETVACPKCTTVSYLRITFHSHTHLCKHNFMRNYTNGDLCTHKPMYTRVYMYTNTHINTHIHTHKHTQLMFVFSLHEGRGHQQPPTAPEEMPQDPTDTPPNCKWGTTEIRSSLWRADCNGG